MPQLKLLLITLFVFLVVSCGANNSPQTTTSSSANSSQNQSSSSNHASNNDPNAKRQQLISPEGIGKAKLGMTLGELKQVLVAETELQTISPFMVDFDAIAIHRKDQAQYYILYPAVISMSDEDTIETLVTDHPNYQTEEGVGPEMTVKEAEAIYGEATLSYHTANESRESVSFAQQSSSKISFLVGTSDNENWAGIYPSSQQQFHKTQQYKDTAIIKSVVVSCGKDC